MGEREEGGEDLVEVMDDDSVDPVDGHGVWDDFLVEVLERWKGEEGG